MTISIGEPISDLFINFLSEKANFTSLLNLTEKYSRADATITFPDVTTETIGWKEEKGKRNNKNVSNSSDDGEFTDGEYLIAIDNRDKFTELKLTKRNDFAHSETMKQLQQCSHYSCDLWLENLF